jgi:cyanophycinase-like exopeptidase
MKISFYFFLLLSSFSSFCFAQSYEKYSVGSAEDLATEPTGGVCLMGGSTENDEAMRWFLQRANGGDVVVLRASGSDGYNNYFLNDLGVKVNSVTTFVCLNAESGSEIEIINAINQAEAIWFAGGNQWNYISYWRNSLINVAINDAIKRKVVIGGTSAGMAILGGYYYTAEKSSVNSFNALKNPSNPEITLDSASFLQTPFLLNTLTDTHFSERERKGRLTVFLAKLIESNVQNVKAIACDEKVAVCIDENGLAQVFTVENETDKSAYFVTGFLGKPEVFSAGQPLTWSNGKLAVEVFQAVGRPDGSSTFDVRNWQSNGNSVRQLYWYVENGTFFENDPSLVLSLSENNGIAFYPNPVKNRRLNLATNNVYEKITVYSVAGKYITDYPIFVNAKSVDLQGLKTGKYVIVFERGDEQRAFKMFVD